MTETVKLALPIALTQLGQIAMMTSDLALIGRLGDKAVAAAALAHTVLFTAFVLGMGIVSAVAPLAAQYYGARQPRMVRRALRVGLWASVILGAPLTLAQLWGGELLLALGQSARARRSRIAISLGMAWCLVPGWFFMALRNFMGAVNRPEPGAVDHARGDPGQRFARLRADLRGVRPAGPRPARRRARDDHRQYRHVRCGDLGLLRAAALQEISRARALVAARLGADAAADRGRRADVGLVPARIRRVRGRRATDGLDRHGRACRAPDRAADRGRDVHGAVRHRDGGNRARRACGGARRCGGDAARRLRGDRARCRVHGGDDPAGGAHPPHLPLLFLGSQAPDPQTVALAASLLVLGASFFIADGVQTIAAGSLRGLNDTRVPLVFAAVSFWLVGFVGCWMFGFTLGLGAYGIWIGLSLGIAVYAVLLIWRFQRLTARHYLPEMMSAVP